MKDSQTRHRRLSPTKQNFHYKWFQPKVNHIFFKSNLLKSVLEEGIEDKDEVKFKSRGKNFHSIRFQYFSPQNQSQILLFFNSTLTLGL